MSNVVQFPSKENFVVMAYDALPDDPIFANECVLTLKFASINDAISAFKSLQNNHDAVELYRNTPSKDIYSGSSDFELIETTQ